MTRLFEAKPFVICEVGSNWRTLDDCLRSIEVAKECGADAVKFQAFNAKALYGFLATSDVPENRYPGSYWNLPLNWLPQLKAHADTAGIEFMCTAFSPELVATVDPYVEVHKVASSDAAWPQLLEAIRQTGKWALVSINGQHSGVDPIAKLDGRVTLMHCIAAYPADFADLPDEFVGVEGGFSDHTLGYTAAVEAARRGAIVIEKHFTAFPDLDTPDRPHSLTPTQFTRMVKLIRGEPVESEETAMYLRHNRRLIATRDVAIGETLRYGENFGAYRSLEDDTRGLSPFAWESAEGKAATVAIRRGKAIGEGDFG